MIDVKSELIILLQSVKIYHAASGILLKCSTPLLKYHEPKSRVKLQLCATSVQCQFHSFPS